MRSIKEIRNQDQADKSAFGQKLRQQKKYQLKQDKTSFEANRMNPSELVQSFDEVTEESIIGIGFADDLDEVLKILSACHDHPMLTEAFLMRHMGEKFAHIGINQPGNRSTKKLAGRR